MLLHTLMLYLCIKLIKEAEITILCKNYAMNIKSLSTVNHLYFQVTDEVESISNTEFNKLEEKLQEKPKD